MIAATRQFAALLGWTCLAFPVYGVAATLAVVASDDGTVILYPLGKTSGLMRAGKSIPAGKSPLGMCLAPDGMRLYVSEAPEKIVAVIDVARQAVVATMEEPGMKRPSGCVVSPDSKRLYLTDAIGNTVFVYDTGSNQFVKQIPVGKEPNHAIFSPDGKRLLVSNAVSNTLSVIDPNSDTVFQTVKTGHEPAFMTYTRDGQFLIVGLIDDDSVAFFKADTLEFDQQVGVVQSPQHLIPSVDGHFLYVLGRWDGLVGVLNLRSRGEVRRLATSIQVPRYPLGMTMSPDGNHLYVSTEHFQNSVLHIDTEILKPDYIISGMNHPGEMVYIK